MEGIPKALSNQGDLAGPRPSVSTNARLQSLPPELLRKILANAFDEAQLETRSVRHSALVKTEVWSLRSLCRSFKYWVEDIVFRHRTFDDLKSDIESYFPVPSRAILHPFFLWSFHNHHPVSSSTTDNIDTPSYGTKTRRAIGILISHAVDSCEPLVDRTSEGLEHRTRREAVASLVCLALATRFRRVYEELVRSSVHDANALLRPAIDLFILSCFTGHAGSLADADLQCPLEEWIALCPELRGDAVDDDDHDEVEPMQYDSDGVLLPPAWTGGSDRAAFVEAKLSGELDRLVREENPQKWRCTMAGCHKLFIGRTFWRKHFKMRHNDEHRVLQHWALRICYAAAERQRLLEEESKVQSGNSC